MFCSFETLRDELKLKQGLRRGGGAAGVSAPRRAGGGGGLPLASSPLAMLGFWRIVLDEAQVVSNTNSAAALMASALWRRHAWVVTGTPADQDVESATAAQGSAAAHAVRVALQLASLGLLGRDSSRLLAAPRTRGGQLSRSGPSGEAALRP